MPDGAPAPSGSFFAWVFPREIGVHISSQASTPASARTRCSMLRITSLRPRPQPLLGFPISSRRGKMHQPPRPAPHPGAGGACPLAASVADFAAVRQNRRGESWRPRGGVRAGHRSQPHHQPPVLRADLQASVLGGQPEPSNRRLSPPPRSPPPQPCLRPPQPDWAATVPEPCSSLPGTLPGSRFLLGHYCPCAGS